MTPQADEALPLTVLTLMEDDAVRADVQRLCFGRSEDCEVVQCNSVSDLVVRAFGQRVDLIVLDVSLCAGLVDAVARQVYQASHGAALLAYGTASTGDTQALEDAGVPLRTRHEVCNALGQWLDKSLHQAHPGQPIQRSVS